MKIFRRTFQTEALAEEYRRKTKHAFWEDIKVIRDGECYKIQYKEYSEKELKPKLVRLLKSTGLYVDVLPEVTIGGPEIIELGGAPIRLDVVTTQFDKDTDRTTAAIYEVKYPYTAVYVGMALGQLMTYAELLKNEGVFEVFKQKTHQKTLRYSDLSFIAYIIQTDRYPAKPIEINLKSNVDLPRNKFTLESPPLDDLIKGDL